MKLLINLVRRCDIFDYPLDNVAVIVLIIRGCDLDVVVAIDHAVLDCFIGVLYFK